MMPDLKKRNFLKFQPESLTNSFKRDDNYRSFHVTKKFEKDPETTSLIGN
jgi:hypothetical protein